jgi:adenosylcobinamide-GDP ribazoletransferase
VKITADFTAALRFLTRLPLPAPDPAPVFGASAFPLVGLMLGLAGLVTDAATRALPSGVRNVGILVLWALATGAIHYDGLADVLDALGGSTREERQRIMRDSAVGVFAVLGLVLLVATELAALAGLIGRARSTALVLSPVLGRWAILLSAFRAPCARDEGLGARFVRDLGRGDVALATLVTLALLTVAAGARGWLAALLVATTAAGIRRLALSAFGGVSGDVLGASSAIAEAAALVFWAAT